MALWCCENPFQKLRFIHLSNDTDAKQQHIGELSWKGPWHYGVRHDELNSIQSLHMCQKKKKKKGWETLNPVIKSQYHNKKAHGIQVACLGRIQFQMQGNIFEKGWNLLHLREWTKVSASALIPFPLPGALWHAVCVPVPPSSAAAMLLSHPRGQPAFVPA